MGLESDQELDQAQRCWVSPLAPPLHMSSVGGWHTVDILMPQVGLETLQSEGQAEAGVESNSEETSPAPCTALPNAKRKVEKVEPSP